MQIHLYGLAHHEPELTHAQLTLYLQMTHWIATDTDQPTWYVAPTGDTADGSIFVPDSPHETPSGVGSTDWPVLFERAIETLATCEGKREEDVTVPYRVLRALGSRRLGAADRQPGAFTTFFPYFILLDLELPTGLPASKNVTLRDVLGHAAFQHWELLEPEAAAIWSRSWKAHLETAQHGYAVWLEKVQ